MCTVSIIPFLPAPSTLPSAQFAHSSHIASAWSHRRIGFRLVTNRDELRSRPPAVDPEWHDFAPTSTNLSAHPTRPNRAIYPIDPAGGGTWVGGSTSGLVLCLLNGNPIPPCPLPPPHLLTSRGVIIPRLFSLAGSSRSVFEALKHLHTFDLNRFAPFRLVAVAPSDDPELQGFVAVEACWDRAELTTREHPPGPACFVSSGLGDPLVKPRITLFNELVRAACVPLADLPTEQDRFHRHTWDDRPEISVMMSRRDARTVSITSVEVIASADADHTGYDLSLEYEPIAERSAIPAPALAKHRVTIPARVARRLT